jgi:hypothetical protein
VKGLETTLSVDLKLIQMEFNKEQQLLVFEQISNTQIIEAKYKNLFKNHPQRVFFQNFMVIKNCGFYSDLLPKVFIFRFNNLCITIKF